jgi:proline racemase
VPFVQESVIGSRFTGRYRRGENGAILPSITGRAWVTAEATLLAEPSDPFPNGIGAVRAAA